MLEVLTQTDLHCRASEILNFTKSGVSEALPSQHVMDAEDVRTTGLDENMALRTDVGPNRSPTNTPMPTTQPPHNLSETSAVTSG